MGHVIVLDASALVDVCARTRLAAWVEDRMGGELACAPAHQPSEVLSAVARLARAGSLPGRTALDALEDAMNVEQEIVVITTAHVRRALDLQAEVRVADGLYVALAEERGCPLVTTDLRLARSVTTCEVWAPQA